MKKEKVTKFDFDAALKAMEALPIPEVHGVLPNRTDFVEETKRVDRTSLLLEDYYDLGNQEALVQAKEEREAEVAKAKLARIEKIVDLDADSPEDLAPSYVGKIILQCPRCMEKFYKDAKDVVYDEDNPELANVGEVCQHCGEDGGYTVIGKVGPVEDSELASYVATDELGTEQGTEQSENPEQAEFNSTPEDVNGQSQDLDLPPVDTNDAELTDTNSVDNSEDSFDKQATLDQSEEQPEAEEEPTEESDEKKKKEIKEESLNTLQENITDIPEADLNKTLTAHNDYIKYLQDSIKAEEAKLAKTDNDFVKDAINKNIESYQAALENALPEEVKTTTINTSDDLPTPEEATDVIDDNNELNLNLQHNGQKDTPKANAFKKEALQEDLGNLDGLVDSILAGLDSSNGNIKEDLDGLSEAVSATELDNLFSSNSFKSAASDEEKTKGRKLAALYAQNKTVLPESLQALHNNSFDKHITKYLTEVYQNVDKFTSTECTIAQDKKTLIIEGVIQFKSGKVQNTTFTFVPTKIINNKYLFEGYNADFNNGNKAYTLGAYMPTGRSFLVTNNFSYKYKIGSFLVEGLN